MVGADLQSCGVEWRWAQLVVVSDVEGVGYRGDDHGCHCCVSSFSGPNSQSEDEWNPAASSVSHNGSNRECSNRESENNSYLIARQL